MFIQFKDLLNHLNENHFPSIRFIFLIIYETVILLMSRSQNETWRPRETFQQYQFWHEWTSWNGLSRTCLITVKVLLTTVKKRGTKRRRKLPYNRRAHATKERTRCSQWYGQLHRQLVTCSLSQQRSGEQTKRSLLIFIMWYMNVLLFLWPAARQTANTALLSIWFPVELWEMATKKVRSDLIILCLGWLNGNRY